MTMDATTAPGPEMGAGSRLINVLFAPAKTFESVARKPGWNWLVPVAILVVLSVIGAVVVAPKIDVDDAVRIQMGKMDKLRPNMTDTQRAQIEDRVRSSMTSFTSGPLRFVGTLFVLVPMFLVPLFYHGIAAAFGKGTQYVTVLAGYAYVQTVQVIKAILILAVASTRSSISILEVNTLVKSNLAALLDPETASRALLSLAASIDVFELWAVALGSIALARTTRLSARAAATTVVGLWLAWVLCQVVLALIGSAFGG